MEYEKPSLLDVNDLSGSTDGASIAPQMVIVLFLVAAVVYTVAGVFTLVGVAAIEAAVLATTAVETTQYTR